MLSRQKQMPMLAVNEHYIDSLFILNDNDD